MNFEEWFEDWHSKNQDKLLIVSFTEIQKSSCDNGCNAEVDIFDSSHLTLLIPLLPKYKESK